MENSVDESSYLNCFDFDLKFAQLYAKKTCSATSN